jgi:hypothetical protein
MTRPKVFGFSLLWHPKHQLWQLHRSLPRLRKWEELPWHCPLHVALSGLRFHVSVCVVLELALIRRVAKAG